MLVRLVFPNLNKMKIFSWLPALTLTFLAIPFFVSGQIAPSSIFREQPTPTPQPSPAQTPAVPPTASIETPPPSKSKKQAAEAETKPAPKTSPTPPVAADDERPPGTDAGTVFKLRQMEKEWEASPNNTATIQKMVADDFIGVTSEGKIVTKKAMLQGSSKENANGSTSVERMDVRLHGAKVAIIVGTAKLTTKDNAGKKSTASYRFTDTWIERGGNWQCIASHSTALEKRIDRSAPVSSNVQTGSHLPRRRY
jgi:ketosteroid isomerase-like protein